MAGHEQTDEWLMNELAAGRREYLETLVRRYAVPLLTFLRRMMDDSHRSEDVFQEVFLAVWKHRGSYSPSRPFRPWLFRIATNKCRELYRGRQRQPLSSLSMFDEPLVAAGHGSGASPIEAAVAQENAAHVAEAVARLPHQQRAVLVMRVWNEQPFEEIADALGCTAGTARSHMHHALTAMRKYLEPRLD